MNTSDRLIETLTSSQVYRDYERAFTEATGLPMALRPVETWQLPMQKSRKVNPFCVLVAGKSRTCAECLQTQERLAQSAREAPAAVTCAYGLSEVAVPVRLGGQIIGYLQTGQVFRRPPGEAGYRKAVAHGRELGIDFSDERGRAAFFGTPVVCPRKIESVTMLLTIFAEHLSARSNEITLRQNNAEPPAISRAKQYIAEHHTEDLTLGQVAQAVHMSVFYFCKLFHKSTGLHFTEYVSRVRIERAKNLLLNPNLRISEIAYEVGFQSLTHFNRVFKQVAGQSPTGFRARLSRAV